MSAARRGIWYYQRYIQLMQHKPTIDEFPEHQRSQIMMDLSLSLNELFLNVLFPLNIRSRVSLWSY